MMDFGKCITLMQDALFQVASNLHRNFHKMLIIFPDCFKGSHRDVHVYVRFHTDIHEALKYSESSRLFRVF